MQIRSVNCLFKPLQLFPTALRGSQTPYYLWLQMPFIIWFRSGSLTGCFSHTELFAISQTGLCFSSLRAFAGSWPLLGAFSFLVFPFPFLPWIPKLIPYLPPLSKYHLFWNRLTTSSPNWGKAPLNVFPWQPGLKYISDNTEMFLYMCLSWEVSWELWMYLFIFLISA